MSLTKVLIQTIALYFMAFIQYESKFQHAVCVCVCFYMKKDYV